MRCDPEHGRFDHHQKGQRGFRDGGFGGLWCCEETELNSSWRRCMPSKYRLRFNKQQAEEIRSMWADGFEPEPHEPQTRRTWVAIGHMALGKAQRIAAGEYGEPEDDMDDNEEPN
jgi:hypothetical protein